MTKYVNKIKQEQGFTLVELLASLMVLALAIGIIYPVMMFGLRSYHKVQIENSLREEADILMSSIISELYVFGPESVSQLGGVSRIELKKRGLNGIGEVGREIQMESGKLFIRDIVPGTAIGENSSVTSNAADSNTGEVLVQSQLIQQGSEVVLTCSDNKSTCSSGLIEINLLLEQNFNSIGYQLELNSRFGF